jgi:hypothetical protein
MNFFFSKIEPLMRKFGGGGMLWSRTGATDDNMAHTLRVLDK